MRFYLQQLKKNSPKIPLRNFSFYKIWSEIGSTVTFSEAGRSLAPSSLPFQAPLWQPPFPPRGNPSHTSFLFPCHAHGRIKEREDRVFSHKTSGACHLLSRRLRSVAIFLVGCDFWGKRVWGFRKSCGERRKISELNWVFF